LGLPLDTLPVIGTAALLLLLVALLVPVWSSRLFPALLGWVTGSPAAASTNTAGGGAQVQSEGAAATPPAATPAAKRASARARRAS
jgi:hypothetical protein